MKLLVTGVTRSGNLGGTAMLCGVEDTIAGEVGDFALASILPEKDRALTGPDHARIVGAGYRYLLLFAIPLCILFWPLRGWASVRRMLARLPYLRDVAAADVIVDLSGIAFVDGRGIALLYYNVAVALPGFFFNKPVHKLSQALGPFHQRFNAILARWTLGRCASVAARGEYSLAHLGKLGIASLHRADTSFAMAIPATAVEQARRLIVAHPELVGEGPLIVCSPSAVVEAHCRQVGVDMVAVLADTLLMLRREGARVALLPHSVDTGIRKNDDVSVVRRVAEACTQRGGAVAVLSAKGDPRLARAIVGQASIFVASRFHSMIAALSQAVPVVTVGWSHKYMEAAAPFNMDRFTLDYAELTVENLGARLAEVLAQRDALHQVMLLAAQAARASAIAGIRVVLGQRG